VTIAGRGLVAAGLVIIVVVAGVVLAGPWVRDTAAPGASPPTAAATPGPSASGTDPLAAPTTGTGATVVDATLLDLLPMTVAGATRRADAASAERIAADPALATTVAAVALALYAGDAGYVVATVSRLRPGVFGADFFRDWRETFDRAVCEQAGGVDVGHSEIVIDGRPAYRSSCVGGVIIHHVHLADRDVIVSLQGAGSADLGRLVVADLAE
jgi:hypothetical protein